MKELWRELQLWWWSWVLYREVAALQRDVRSMREIMMAARRNTWLHRAAGR